MTLKQLKDIALEIKSISPQIVFAGAYVEFVNIRKIFISPQRNLEQSYISSQADIDVIAKKEETTKTSVLNFGGIKGFEIISEMVSSTKKAAAKVLELLDSETIVPGEYEVIADPDMTGLIAHEAFGHGVEIDMFVKERSLGKHFLGKKVGSPLLNMYDGAKEVKHQGSYLFDDEGTLASHTAIIQEGILMNGISDLASALSEKKAPTGNGRRQAYDHKVYSRMTNTFIAPGNHTLEEMISSITNGYLLEKSTSGMEDPKNWGIQMVASIGREIKNGKLTGKVVAPVVCTGYVPELLSNISMVSSHMELFSGGCGKGHKEWISISSGGPYIKTKMRLG